MNLYNDIMNIPADYSEALRMLSQAAYKSGRRDARHAAAELSLKYERALYEAQSTLELLAARETDRPSYCAMESLKEIGKILHEDG